ncbi:helix-turn-helix domain containing protein [Nocardiopsis sp. N85]|uniref:TetR/AcrR family transcriptional regulator n=1 Tax=Nocardiopsis sp. N85 TaxID=3029400 RepID=UPI00237F992D|nr:TetR/AcrR family transcriptional regulator [Nocardiopsis sp. N85]MDE3724983.1 helix-turn-helix domain containing protein [Nocardiopsis sp. N85]
MVRERSGARGASVRVPTREVVLAAVRLFTEGGFETTTMDDIAAATGVSRRSLFRRFGSKEDILFAEHDELFASVSRHLEADSGEPLDVVFAAARLVLQGYLSDPEVTVPRYHLVRAHPRLRDREVAMTARYQAAFSRYLAAREGEGGPEERSLAAGVTAAALISAHNHVLRSWLRHPGQETREVWTRYDSAMEFVRRAAGPMLHPADDPVRDRVMVAVYPADLGREELLRRLSAAVDGAVPRH